MINSTHLSKNTFFNLLLLSLIFLLNSCDTFEEDLVPETTKLKSDKQYLIPPNTSAIIDFTTLINVRETIKVSIKDELNLGSISPLGESLYKYTPKSNISGKEEIAFDVFNEANKHLLTDTISVIITSQPLDSCFLSAIEDRIYVEEDSTVVIEVLKNDFICGEEVDISIIKQPDLGDIQAFNTHITYEAKATSGIDEFVYRISSRNNSLINSDALVILYIGESSCQVVAYDDYYNYNVDVPNQFFEVLFNDSICGNQQDVTLISEPKIGAANFATNNLLEYIPPSDSYGFLDSLVYEVCEGANCDRASVLINVYKGICDFVDAVDDEIDLRDSTVNEPVFINVVSNDIFCSSFNLSIIENVKNGSLTLSDNGYYYDPNEALADDSFTYELCLSEDNTKCDQALVTILRE